MLKALMFLLLSSTFVFAGDLIRSKNSVIDIKHHLQWQDTADMEENDAIWKMQKAHCQGLHLSGFNDWRLPTKEELSALAKSKEAKKVFLHLSDHLFWSGEENPQDDINAFTVYMPNGYISSSDKCEKNHSLCVRSR
ncbi:DUF1566 domain-containing protein [Sulfurimonas sp. HSL-1716]|uniref:Lcl C-terminal domain-containing protein n=1 Tax=Hydrocurvibacter sulfurireducens TaxID=3131937 RepID=UPI0031F73354